MGTLAGIFGGDRQTSALDDIFSTPTQTGINQAESKNIDDNITQLTALRGRSKDPADQARIDKAIASLRKQQGEVGYAKPSGGAAGGYADIARGVAAGVAKGPVEVGELAAAVPALMGSQTAKDLRSSLAERAATITSEAQPPGFGAAVGEFGGELPAQALAFGPVSKVVGAVAGKVPLLSRIFAPVAGNLATRVAIGAAKAGVEVSPITAIASAANRQDALEGAKQALASGDITQEQYDKMSSMATVEAIKQFAESTLGAAAFGALSPAEKAKAGAGTKVPVGGGPAQTEVVQREAELQAINAKAAADAARREEAKQLKKLAKAQWTLDNPHGTWSDLETEEQAKYISDFKAKQAAAATPKTATPPEQTPPAQAEAEHNLDRAQAAGTPEAVQAAEAKVEESKLVGLDNQGRPVTTQQVAELAPPRPDLDKGDGGLSPTVKNYIQRQGLKNAFKQADLPFDEGLTNVQLQERLDQGIQAKAAEAKAATQNASRDITLQREMKLSNDEMNTARSAFARAVMQSDLDPNLADKIKSGEMSLHDAAALFDTKPYHIMKYAKSTPAEMKADIDFYQPMADKGAPGPQMALTGLETFAEKRGIKLDDTEYPKTAAEVRAMVDKAKLDMYLPQPKFTAEHAKISPETVETDYGSLTGEKKPKFKILSGDKASVERLIQEDEISATTKTIGQRFKEITGRGMTADEIDSFAEMYPSEAREWIESLDKQTKADKEFKAKTFRTLAEAQDAFAKHNGFESFADMADSFQAQDGHPNIAAMHRQLSSKQQYEGWPEYREMLGQIKGAEGAAVPAVSPPQDARSQLSAGTSSSSPPTAVDVPTRTFLTGVPHEQPLEAMNVAQLDKMKDLVADGIVEASGPHRQQLVGDLSLLAKETLRREATTSVEAPTRPYQHLDPNDLQTHREALEAKIEELSGQVKELKGAPRDGAKADLVDAKARLADIKTEIGTRKVEAREAKKSGEAKQLGVAPEAKPTFDYRKAPSKLGDRDLAAQIEDLHSKLEVLDPRDSHEYQERLGKLLEEQAKRSKGNSGPDGMPPIKPGDGGLKLQSHPAVGAFLGGFSYGLITPQPGQDDEQYLSRAFMYGLGSAGLVMGAKYLGARNKALETPKPSTTIPNLDQFPKVVFSADEIKGPKTSTLAKLREFYRGTVRGTEAIEQMTKSTGGLNLPTQQNPGKLAAYWGRYAAQTEHWLTVGPALVADDGSVTHLSGLSHNDIINKIAQGDKEGLDNLMVALSSAELAGKLGEKRVPMGQLQREYIIRNAPQNLMDAAKAMREYHANLLQTQLDAGLISKEGLAKMVSENYYTPMQRVIERLDEIRQRKPNFKGQPTALEAREGGSQMKVKSPSEVTVEMTGRMLRAAEYGKFLNAFVDHVQSLPSFVRQEIMVPTNRSMNPKAGDLEALATELRKATSLSEADARSMVAYLDSDAIHSNPGIITHYNNGVLQSYKVRPDIFQAIKSMTAPEIDGFWRMLGIPTRLATQGTVLNPMFTFRRGFIETFLGHLGSEYGFRPVLDQIPAWWEAFTRSPRFREMQAAGGTGSVQSMQFQQIAKFGGNNALADSWNLMKEGNPIQAYRTLMEPFTMTARVAEYLAALRHGASTLEAAYAANNLLGNVRMQGYMNGMRVFNHLAMFSRPTIAHVDRLLEKSGFHPYRVPEYNKTATGQAFQDAGVSPRIAAAMTFMTKGFVGITLPTVALWYMNRNDDEINEVRKTSAGSHYWFMRNPFVEQGQQGSIVRIPRPQGVGQVFGGSAEATLDRMDANDHDGTMRMLSGLYDEVSLNVLPQIGVVPMGLWANRDYRFGSPIVRGSDAGADPNMQGFTDASLPSRIISDKVSDFAKDSNNETLRRALSPAGLDYVFNTFAGMMGQDALRAVNDAMLYHRDGFLPAKEELPLVSRVLARYPSMGVNSIQKFYERDQKVQAAAETVNKLVKENPQMLADYYSHNSERLSLVRVHQEVRQKIADLRRAMEDIKNAPPGTYDQKGKEDLNKKFTELIIQHAKIANEIAANIGVQ